jgi:hypothetical protein
LTEPALHELHGARVLALAPDGATLRSERDAVDLLGECYAHQPDWIALPVARLGAEFFELRTRVLGEVVQKFVNYGLRVAIVGDVSQHVAASNALRDFVREANRGRSIWFAPSLAALGERLERR